MAHDASKVLMGVGKSSFKVVDNKKGSILAGVVARQKSDGTISTVKTDGAPLGVSFGQDMSNAGRTAICRSGLAVPLRLTASFVPVKGAQVFISDTTGLGIASGAGATGVNAQYASEALTAVLEDGTEVVGGAALIDMQGGL